MRTKKSSLREIRNRNKSSKLALERRLRRRPKMTKMKIVKTKKWLSLKN